MCQATSFSDIEVHRRGICGEIDLAPILAMALPPLSTELNRYSRLLVQIRSNLGFFHLCEVILPWT